MNNQFIIVKSRICNKCNKEFIMSGGDFANHVRYCNLSEHDNIKQSSILSKAIFASYDLKYGKFNKFLVTCDGFDCGKSFYVNERQKQFPKKDKYFCSKKCANTRVHSQETISKIKNCICKNGKTLSQNSIDLWKDDNFSKRVLKNNTYFTSKGERYLRNYFMTTYVNEAWTFGGRLSYNNVSGIVRDLYTPLLKICIEYDGIWHFEDICGQLKSKQEKDKALEDWCMFNKFRLIRIKDDVFQKDRQLWINNIRKEIENPTSDIVKFY